MAQDYSDWLRKKTNIGISQLYFDVATNKDPKVDLGVLYSNGSRYSFLSYRGQVVSQCSSVNDMGVVYNTAYVGDKTLFLSSNIK